MRKAAKSILVIKEDEETDIICRKRAFAKINMGNTVYCAHDGCKGLAFLVSTLPEEKRPIRFQDIMQKYLNSLLVLELQPGWFQILKV